MDNATPYKAATDIPDALYRHIHAGTFKEQFISAVMSSLRGANKEGMTLTVADIEALKETDLKRTRANIMSMFVFADSDMDGFLSVEELNNKKPPYSAKDFSKFKELDTNADGKVSYQEAAAAPIGFIEIPGYRYRNTEELLALDPNKDGTLTSRELLGLAEQAFALIDRDDNGQISDIEYPGKRAPATLNQKPTCGFKDKTFSTDMVIFSGGDYRGKETSGYIDTSNHKATTFEVIVNHPQSPVALILGAYEPSVWDIRVTPGTKISAVVLGGYHHQVAMGLPNNTPIITNTHQDRENSPCRYFYLSRDAKNLAQVNPLSRKIFGKDATLFAQPDKNSRIVFGAENFDSAVLSSANDPKFITKKTMPKENKPPAEKSREAIEAAQQSGILLTGTIEEATTWEEALYKVAKEQPRDIPPIAGETVEASIRKEIHRIPPGTFYVVQKDLTLTEELTAYPLRLFVPKGIRVDGTLGRITIFDMNTMNCAGMGCPH